MEVDIFMEKMDQNVIQKQIKDIEEDIGKRKIEMKMEIKEYIVEIEVLIKVRGWMEERFGEKKVFREDIEVFVVG